MAIEITPEFIQARLRADYENPAYKGWVKKSDEILLHSSGKGFTDKLSEYRPSEPQSLYDYRTKNGRLITKSAYSKIKNVLGKIDRAAGFTVVPPDTRGASEAVRWFVDYAFENYPYYDSVRQWFFTLGLDYLLTEPNGVIAVLPESWEWGPTERPRPVMHFFEAEMVLDYMQGEYVFIKLDDKSRLNGETEKSASGRVYMLITATEVTRYEQYGLPHDNTFRTILLGAVPFGEMPAFRMGGVHTKEGYFESFIAGIVPYFDEALVQYSDMQGGIKMHLYPEAAVYAVEECNKCQGGWVRQAGLNNNNRKKCTNCNGTGNVPSPHANIVIKQGITNNENIYPDWYPKKYITKDVEPIKVLAQQITDNLYNGYSALNMQFLADTPLNQSGTAKEVDREELNSFIHTVAIHIKRDILTPCYWYIMLWGTVPVSQSVQAAGEALPIITVPESFDVVTASVYEAEYAGAKAAGVGPEMLSQMEIKLAEKRFMNHPEKVIKIKLANYLNPVPNRTEEEKYLMLSSGGITKADYIISCNIQRFVTQALLEVSNFEMLEYAKQRDILLGYAAEVDPTVSADTVPAEGKDAMQGVSAIVDKYFAGKLPYESAITQLTVLYKQSPEDARALLAGALPEIDPAPDNTEPTPPAR